MSASDDVPIRCVINNAVTLPPEKGIIELAGEVTKADQLTLSMDDHYIIPLGNDLDLKLVNSTVNLMHHPQVRECFEVCASKSA